MDKLEEGNPKNKLKFPRTEGHSFPDKMVSPVSSATDENPIVGTS